MSPDYLPRGCSSLELETDVGQWWNSGGIVAVNTGKEFLPHSSGHGAPLGLSQLTPYSSVYPEPELRTSANTGAQPADVQSVSAAFLFELLCTIVRDGVDNAEVKYRASVLRDLEIFTPVVSKISFLCDANFCPSLRDFLFCPEDGSIVCVRNVEFG